MRYFLLKLYYYGNSVVIFMQTLDSLDFVELYAFLAFISKNAAPFVRRHLKPEYTLYTFNCNCSALLVLQEQLTTDDFVLQHCTTYNT